MAKVKVCFELDSDEDRNELNHLMFAEDMALLIWEIQQLMTRAYNADDDDPVYGGMSEEFFQMYRDICDKYYNVDID